MATVTLTDGMIVAGVGDSTTYPLGVPDTAWYESFVPAVNAQFTPVAKVWPAKNTGTQATHAGTQGVNNAVTPPGAITFLGLGVPGSTIEGLNDIIAGLMSANSPAVVFVATGTNDIPNGTSPSAFATLYTQMLSRILAYNAATQIVCMSIYMRGETWGAGPVWVDGGGVFPAGTNAAVDALNAQIASCAATAGALYINTRAQFLPWEVINNPTNLVSTVATNDGVHLDATGKAVISTFVLPSVTVVP